MPATSERGRHAAAGDGRLGGRRQVDADRAAALRLEVDPGRPARAHRRGLARAQRQRASRPRAADRRPARRARAGHHDRRRAPLLRDPAPALHPRRHAGPRAVHAQHGHRRLDGGGGDRAGRRAPGRGRADTPACAQWPGCCVSVTSSLAVNKMDLVDWSEEVFDRIVADFDCFASKIGLGGGHAAAAVARCTATTSSSRPSGSPGTPGRRCSSTSRPSSCPPRRPAGCRLPGAVGARAARGARATPAASAAGELRPGDEVVALPARRARAWSRGRDARRAARGRAAGAVGVGAPRPRARPRRAATCWPPPSRRP